MPAIKRDAVVPPDPEFRQPGVLRFEFEGREVFEGVGGRGPFDADVVDGLLREVLEELGPEGVGYFVREVEGAGVLGLCGWRMLVSGGF